MDEFTQDNLVVKFDEINSDKLVADWVWLIGTDKKPVIVSAIGDMFLKDNCENFYFLDVGQGTLELVANNLLEFNEKLKVAKQLDEWFMIDLTTELKFSEKQLKAGQLYSYIRLPIIGGEYSVDNFVPLDIEAHFSFAGQIHKQIRDLPEGTNVNVKFIGE